MTTVKLLGSGLERKGGSALTTLQGKGAKEPGQGAKAQRQGEPLGGEGTSKERGRIHEMVQQDRKEVRT